MNVWIKNSMKNLLPLSQEPADFKEALKEWFFSGEIIDHEAPIEACGLCEKDELRYHFQISNDIGNSLWVGSKCIEKFNITVRDENGIEVTGCKETYLLKQARRKHVSMVFQRLSETKPKGEIKGHRKIELDNYCINKFNLEERLDPKMLNYLFMRLDEEDIKHEKRFFAISLRSQDNKDKLLVLRIEQFERIKKALTSQQRKFYLDNHV